MKPENRIKLPNGEFEIIDALSNVTIPDSFIFNKIGTGHGERKMYVGNINNPSLTSFFDNFNRECFFLKKDLIRFSSDIEPEILTPQQPYANPQKLLDNYNEGKNVLNSINSEIVSCDLYRVDVAPPRVYINSKSQEWDIIRKLALPNICYASFLKLRNSKGKIVYYCRPFLDYRNDIVKYDNPLEIQQETLIEASDFSEKRKEHLLRSRTGQGLYRTKLLEECPYCPISMINDERLLIASHIKPWAVSDDKEKVDPKNGFILSPNYDCLFDNGFMTFTQDKELIISPWISPMNQKRLGVYTGMKVPRLPIDDEREHYLKYHRDNIYKGISST